MQNAIKEIQDDLVKQIAFSRKSENPMKQKGWKNEQNLTWK